MHPVKTHILEFSLRTIRLKKIVILVKNYNYKKSVAWSEFLLK